MSKPKYWWFQGESVTELTEQLAEGGADARLEVHIDEKDSMTFKIVKGDYHGPSINASHVCPPDCG